MSEGDCCFAFHTADGSMSTCNSQVDLQQGAAEPEKRTLAVHGTLKGDLGKMPHQRAWWPGSATGYH